MARVNCRAAQEELMLGFGVGRPSDELEQHLTACSSCRREQLRLQSLAKRLGADHAFHPDDAEVERVAARVESALDRTLSERLPVARRVFSDIRLKYIAAAAVFVFAIGVYVAGYMSAGSRHDNTAASTVDTTSLVSGDEADAYELSDATAQALLYDFSARYQLTAGEELLDDLTPDEMEYLKKNFDVGELLL